MWLSVILPAGGRASIKTLYWTDEYGNSSSGELQFDVLADAGDVDEAISISQRNAVSLASVCSYLANGPVGEPRLVLVDEVGPDDERREYHYLHSRHPRASLDDSGRHHGDQRPAGRHAFPRRQYPSTSRACHTLARPSIRSSRIALEWIAMKGVSAGSVETRPGSRLRAGFMSG